VRVYGSWKDEFLIDGGIWRKVCNDDDETTASGRPFQHSAAATGKARINVGDLNLYVNFKKVDNDSSLALCGSNRFTQTDHQLTDSLISVKYGMAEGTAPFPSYGWLYVKFSLATGGRFTFMPSLGGFPANIAISDIPLKLYKPFVDDQSEWNGCICTTLNCCHYRLFKKFTYNFRSPACSADLRRHAVKRI